MNERLHSIKGSDTMKNVWLAVIGLAVIGYGCGPQLAQTPYGEKETQWKEYISSAYPSWQPPQTVPPVESIVPQPGQAGESSNTSYPEAQDLTPVSGGNSSTAPGLKPLPALAPTDNAPAASVTPTAPAPASALPASDVVPAAPAIESAPAAETKAPALDAGIPEANAASPVFNPNPIPAKAAKATKASKAGKHHAAAAVASAAGGQVYVVQKGDSLTKISLKFYKSAGKYKVIENANKEALKKGLRSGMKLHIPALK